MTKIIRNDSMKTENDNVEEVIGKIASDLYEILAPEPEQRNVIGQTLQLLAANGSPVTHEEIAIRLSASPDEVTSTLRKFGTELDQKGNILGLGLTLIPTPHVYKVNGRRLFVWCAADALAFPVVLRHSAHVESPDPVTRKKIRISITPDKVEKIEPKNAVVSLVKKIDVTNIRSNFCNNVNFFSSPEIAAEWISERPNMMFYPVSEIYQEFKNIHLNKYRDVMAQTSKHEGRRICC
jgi:alkylmercury lyase